MEYVQMTLDEWVSMKEQLKKELNGVVCGFVRIGSILRKIEEEKLYKKDGYKSIAEFAKAEYKLEGYDVSRFIKINKRFTLEDNPDRLRPEFEHLGYSKLSDMLKLPDSDLTMINQDTPRKSIRELKQFNKSEPASFSGGISIREVIEDFYKDNPEILNDLYTSEAYTQNNIAEMADLINPAGTRTYRRGMYFLMMQEKEIKIKQFGGIPKEMSWSEFFAITQEIFESDAAGSRTYENHFGVIIDQEKTKEKEPEKEQEPPRQIEEMQSFAPAQKKPENTEREADFKEPKKLEKMEKVTEKSEGQQTEPGVSEEEQIPGQMEITRDMPEYCPSSLNQPEKPENAELDYREDSKSEPTVKEILEGEEQQTELEKPEMTECASVYGSRKQYLDTLTEYGAALYIAASMQGMRNATFTKLLDPEYWQKWLKTEVDENGEAVEVVE